MFYSQVILAKKGPLAKVWLAAHWGDKKLARPQIFATDISQSCTDIMNPSVPLALRLSGHLLLGVVRIYSRKVKYVLNDCTEAMLKLQMAFTGANNTGSSSKSERELLTDQDAPTNNLVSNFGEYDQVHVVEGFCLPLPEDNEWILAEDDEDESSSQQNGGQHAILLAAHLPQASQQGRHSGSSPRFPSPEEETWAPFDPDNEDEEDDDNPPLPSGSRISEIELVRAANDSILSEDQTRRASSILNDSKDLPGFPAQGEKDREEPDEDFNVPFADDSEDENGPAGVGVQKLDDSMLQLSQEGGSAGKNNNNNLSGLDDSPSSKRSREEEIKPRKKRRKRRKVVIDNHKTELSNEQIRQMLKDTSDIVRKMVHPASWDGDESIKLFASNPGEKRQPPILTQPFLADEGDRGGPRLHPRLRKLWEDNYWRALGNPCPYRKQAAPPEEDDEGDSVEQVRRDQEVDEEKDDHSSLEVPMPDAVDSKKEGTEETDDFYMPQMDDEEELEDEPAEGPALDLDEDEEQVGEDEEDDLNLGLVNDMAIDSDDDEDAEDRQALGDVMESTAKWHKHTVRVYKHLKKCMRDLTAPIDEDDEEAKDLPGQVQFFDITKNVKTRRNAASVFFEILQLKTWDFIDVNQDDAYGDITISPSVRFGEDPPN
ncbi:mitotic cohesin [Nitzschia inconspicua]|uniref:Mitotic cohesin n=1 Tax=Nitzschia inconspicua TaxID=303405 RepID=A0A9K3LCD2_9STRA|nr:mitotic cohesin [Nitzschia inconspicua]